MSIEDEDEVKRIQAKLAKIAETPALGVATVSTGESHKIYPPTQKGVSTAEIAQLVITLTETIQETNKKLTDLGKALNALQESVDKAQK